MGSQTRIEWTEAVWNPVTGCTWASTGCDHCYARVMGTRLAGIKGNPRFGKPFSEVMCHVDRLSQPINWKRPRMVFVNSMSDLFHEDVPAEFIADIWAVMAACRGKHTFQVLTKRPDRMSLLLRNSSFKDMVMYRLGTKYGQIHGIREHFEGLSNVWLGVTAENQEQADRRIPFLIKTPAAVRWVSVEPMLGPVDLRIPTWTPTYGLPVSSPCLPSLNWVVCGGESGNGSRPFHTGWAMDLRDQCQAAGIPFFMKQLGAKAFMSMKDEESGVVIPERIETVHPKGGDPMEWPDDLRVREFPE